MQVQEPELKKRIELFTQYAEQMMERQIAQELLLIRSCATELTRNGDQLYNDEYVADAKRLHRTQIMHEHGFLRHSIKDVLDSYARGDDVSEALPEIDNERYGISDLLRRMERLPLYRRVLVRFYVDHALPFIEKHRTGADDL